MDAQQLSTFLRGRHACREGLTWSEGKSLHEAWQSCERGDWMLWFAERVGVDRVRLVRIACYCARDVLRHAKPGDDRPLLAIQAAERWCQNPKEARAAYAAACAADAAAAYASADAAAAAYAADNWLGAQAEKLRAYAAYVRQQITVADLLAALEASA